MQRLDVFRCPEVLVIDARRPCAAALLDLLAAHSLDPLVATSVGDGVRVAQVAQPDIVLMDASLEQALAGCQRLHMAPDTAHIPVILWAQHPSGTQQRQALACGAADYLAQPFSPRTLLAHLCVHLCVAPYQRMPSGIALREALGLAARHCKRGMQMVLAVNALVREHQDVPPEDAQLTERLAQRLDVSQAELAGVFLRQFGMGVPAYHQLLLLDGARRRLCSSALKPNDIAVRAGYGSQRALVHAFRLHYGLGPRLYQRLCAASRTVPLHSEGAG